LISRKKQVLGYNEAQLNLLGFAKDFNFDFIIQHGLGKAHGTLTCAFHVIS
jgi:hypothetical protein